MSSATDRELPAPVAAALGAAEIPLSKLGPARRARLGAPEQALYFWILHRFARTGRPESADTRAEARRLGLEAADALVTLEREDVVHHGADGEITVAYPFSGVATAHQVRFPDGHEVAAMCALDALGIAPMFGVSIEVESRDPVSSAAIRVQVGADGAAEWQPEPAVVVCGVLDQQSDSCHGCCPVLNFFASPATAERWLSEHRHVRGDVISINEAAAAGKAIFGDVLTDS